MLHKKKLTTLILIVQVVNALGEYLNPSLSQCPDSNKIKILECKSTRSKKSSFLSNYECRCIHLENGEVFNCLRVYVGMAIKGHNLLYNRWIDKENCMSICLNTTVNNGHKFDCKSFEHWHGNCSQSADPQSPHYQLCASFDRRQKISRRNHQESKNRPKLDYCVLSNQTINSVGPDFNSNNAVTYYELACQRNDRLGSTTQKSNEQIFKTTKLIEFVPRENHRANECSFNPCLNGGTCVLGENDRFKCLCYRFYHGINCELSEYS